MRNTHDGLYKIHAIVEFFEQFCFVSGTPNVGVGGVCLFLAGAVGQLARGEEFTHFAASTKFIHECGVEPRLVNAQRRIDHEPIAIKALDVVSLVSRPVTPNIDVVTLHRTNKKCSCYCAAKWGGVEICFARSSDMKCTTLQCNETFANKFFAAIDETSKFCSVLFGAVRYLVELWFVGLAKVCGVAIWQRAFFAHPRNCSRSVESTRKSNTHSFPGRELREDFRA